MGRKFVGTPAAGPTELVTKAVTDALATRATNLENTTPPFTAWNAQAWLATTFTVATTATTDFPNLSISVPVPSSAAVYEVIFQPDFETLGAATANCVISLLADGVAIQGQWVANGGSNTFRLPSPRVWSGLTGFTAGNVLFKLTYQSGTASQHKFYGNQTALYIKRIA